jgi:hypothetical protein
MLDKRKFMSSLDILKSFESFGGGNAMVKCISILSRFKDKVLRNSKRKDKLHLIVKI